MAGAAARIGNPFSFEVVPEYIYNDPVRLISLRQFVDPSFLYEWLHLAGYDEDSLTIGFKVLLAPLWLCTKDGVLVALAGRIIVGAVLCYALVRLARSL